jgi:hypothetical protein
MVWYSNLHDPTCHVEQPATFPEKKERNKLVLFAFGCLEFL